MSKLILLRHGQTLWNLEILLNALQPFIIKKIKTLLDFSQRCFIIKLSPFALLADDHGHQK